MFSLFSPDSRFMQVLSRFADLVVLNLLFLLTSLPLFTLGASSAAMYTLTFRMLRGKEESIVKSYFRAFRENFRQSTALWLILLAAGVPALYYAKLLHAQAGAAHYLFLPCLTLFAVTVFTGSFAFPLASQFQSSLTGTLRNALLLSLAHLPRALALALIHLFPLGLLLLLPDFFLQVSFLWVALYFSAAAYMSTAVLWKAFQPFYPEEN